MASANANEFLYVVIVGFIGGVVSLCGLVGNCLSLPVLLKKEMRASTSTLCLIMLGVYDLLLLITDFVTTSLDWSVFGVDEDSLFLYEFSMPASVVGDPLVMVLITSSVYTTVILSLDRCLAVLRPLQWSSISTRRRLKLALFLVFIFAVVINSPVYFQAEYHIVFFSRFNRTFVSGAPTKYYFSYFHQVVYMQYLLPIFQIIIPLVFIVSSNTAIVVKILLHRRRSKALHGNPTTHAPSTVLSNTSAMAPVGSNNFPTTIDARRKSSGSSSSTLSHLQNSKATTTSTTTMTSTTNPPPAASSTTTAIRKKPRAYGVDVSRLTAQVVAISIITMTSRALAAANFYIVAEEDIFYIKYCSKACVWTGALNILFIKINSSVNFLFYCFFGQKFRTLFKATFSCTASRSQPAYNKGSGDKQKKCVHEATLKTAVCVGGAPTANQK